MNIEELRNICLNFNGVTEEMPFGPDTLVFKVLGKIFALLPLDRADLPVNLKCEPAYAEELRERYPEIVPGYHMNKKHWNTVHCNGAFSHGFISELVEHSYNETVKGLSKKLRAQL